MSVLSPSGCRRCQAFVLLAILALFPSPAFCEEWMGGAKGVLTITKIDAESNRFLVAGQQSIVWAWTDNIRRIGRGNNVQIPFSSLQAGMRVKVYGSYGSSPLGMIAQKVVVITDK